MVNRKSGRPRYLVLLALSASRSLSVFIMFISAVSAAGYLTEIPYLYRPSGDQAATHPFTCAQIFILALCIFVNRPGHRQNIKWLLGLSFMLSLVLLIDSLLSLRLSDYVIPFNRIAAQEHSNGLTNHVGLNTFITFMLVWFSVILRINHRPLCSQGFAFVALSLPSLALFGYAYSLHSFHGEMSLISAVSLCLLCCSALWSTANHGALRAVLSPYIGGRIARFQFTTGFIVVFSFGYLLVRSIASIDDSDRVGAYAVAVCWLIIILVTISATLFEQVDKYRRRMENRLLISSRTDPLTGLLNRRAFDEVLQYESTRSGRQPVTASLLLLDIDHFKQVNDIHGHPAGDMVLQRIAELLKTNLRDTDSLCRFGGEEFAVLLPDTCPEGAMVVAKTLRKFIDDEIFRNEEGTTIPVTASFGVTNLTKGGISSAVGRADQALYQSKQRGRNRVSANVLVPPRSAGIGHRSNQVVRQLAF